MKKNEFGSIEVNMGDGNSVGDIGHKITFHTPPPDPNAIYQSDRVVGTLGSEPYSQTDGTFVFSKLFFDTSFDVNGEFEVQGEKFRIVRCGAVTETSMGGRPPQTTVWNAICKGLTGRDE